jgi:hypothetical protein
MICSNPQCFVRKDTVIFPHDLAFLLIKKNTRLILYQLNIKKKINKDNFGRKKTHEEKRCGN